MDYFVKSRQSTRGYYEGERASSKPLTSSRFAARFCFSTRVGGRKARRPQVGSRGDARVIQLYRSRKSGKSVAYSQRGLLGVGSSLAGCGSLLLANCSHDAKRHRQILRPLGDSCTTSGRAVNTPSCLSLLSRTTERRTWPGSTPIFARLVAYTAKKRVSMEPLRTLDLKTIHFIFRRCRIFRVTFLQVSRRRRHRLGDRPGGFAQRPVGCSLRYVWRDSDSAIAGREDRDLLSLSHHV